MSIDEKLNVWPEWQLKKKIGEGSFGKVFMAVRQEHSVQSYAAIKVISIPQNEAEIDSVRSEMLDVNSTRTYFETIMLDFINEIKLLDQLKGTANVVSIEDYKVVEKSEGIGWDIYIRMELLTSINDHFTNRAISEAEVIKLGEDICGALELCSRKNIIHRDIKPENIFISDFGDFKVGDFGIARELEKTTSALSAKGTYNYMAPEILSARQYDASVDTYSLGLVLYKLLNNNRLPFIDPQAPIVQYHDRTQAVNRRLSGEALPAPINASPALTKIILKACAFDPQQRYSSASEMKKALRALSPEASISTTVALDRNTPSPAADLPRPDCEISFSQEKDDSSIQATMLIEDDKTLVQNATFVALPESNNSLATKPNKKKRLYLLLIGGVAALLAISLFTFFIISASPKNLARRLCKYFQENNSAALYDYIGFPESPYVSKDRFNVSQTQYGNNEKVYACNTYQESATIFTISVDYGSSTGSYRLEKIANSWKLSPARFILDRAYVSVPKYINDLKVDGATIKKEISLDTASENIYLLYGIMYSDYPAQVSGDIIEPCPFVINYAKAYEPGLFVLPEELLTFTDSFRFQQKATLDKLAMEVAEVFYQASFADKDASGLKPYLASDATADLAALQQVLSAKKSWLINRHKESNAHLFKEGIKFSKITLLSTNSSYNLKPDDPGFGVKYTNNVARLIMEIRVDFTVIKNAKMSINDVIALDFKYNNEHWYLVGIDLLENR